MMCLLIVRYCCSLCVVRCVLRGDRCSVFAMYLYDECCLSCIVCGVLYWLPVVRCSLCCLIGG